MRLVASTVSPRALLQQRGHAWRGAGHLLDIVQDQQQAPLAQVSWPAARPPVGRRALAARAPAPSLGARGLDR